jgi:hypothetical protein
MPASSAGADVFGQTGFVFPQALTAAGVDGVDAGVGGGDVDHPIMHQGLGFLAALLFTAEREAPGGYQLMHVLGGDALGRAVALGFYTQAVGEHVLGGLVIVAQVVPGDIACQGRGGQPGQQQGEGGATQGAFGLEHGRILVSVSL